MTITFIAAFSLRIAVIEGLICYLISNYLVTMITYKNEAI